MNTYLAVPILSPDTQLLAPLEEAIARAQNIISRINAYSQVYMDKGDIVYEKSYMIDEQDTIARLIVAYYKELNGLDDVSANNVRDWMNQMNDIINNRIQVLDNKLTNDTTYIAEKFDIQQSLFSVGNYQISTKTILIILIVIALLWLICRQGDSTLNMNEHVSAIEQILLNNYN